jgi:hypothetical protein
VEAARSLQEGHGVGGAEARLDAVVLTFSRLEVRQNGAGSIMSGFPRSARLGLMSSPPTWRPGDDAEGDAGLAGSIFHIAITQE